MEIWQKKTDVVWLLKYPTLLSTGSMEFYVKYSKVHIKLFLSQVLGLMNFLTL